LARAVIGGGASSGNYRDSFNDYFHDGARISAHRTWGAMRLLMLLDAALK
jgi:hypothetical protein